MEKDTRLEEQPGISEREKREREERKIINEMFKVSRSGRHKFSGWKDPTKHLTHQGSSSLNFRLMKTIRKFHKLLEWDRVGKVHTKKQEPKCTQSSQQKQWKLEDNGIMECFQIQEEQLKILHPAKLSIKYDDSIKTFSDIWGVKILTSQFSFLKKLLKNLLPQIKAESKKVNMG